MIKINLLPEKEVKRKKPSLKSPASKLLSTIIVLTGITLLVMLAITYYMRVTKDDLNRQYQSNQIIISQLQKNIEEAKRYEKMNETIKQKTTLIETLRKNQAIPVRILDEISTLLPNGVWLYSLLYKSESVTLEGYAFTNLDIVSYVDNLKKSSLIIEPTVEESKYEELEKVPVYKFKISFKIK